MASRLMFFVFAMGLLLSLKTYAQSDSVHNHRDFSHLTDSTFHPFDNTAVLKYNINMDLGFNYFIVPNIFQDDIGQGQLRKHATYNFSVHFFRQFKAWDGHFIFKIGGGFGFWKMSVNQNYIFQEQGQLNLSLVEANSLNYQSIKKNKFGLNYFELPTEFMLKTNWNVPLKFGFGHKLGFAFSKVIKTKVVDSQGENLVFKLKNSNGYSLLLSQVYMRLVISHIGFYSSFAMNSVLKYDNLTLGYQPITFGITYMID